MRRNASRYLSLVWALGLLPVAAGLLSGCGYNSIQAADEDVKAAWADVQNQYQRRMDLVPNLVNTVKGAADFEQETLQAVVEARSRAAGVKIDEGLLQDPEAFQRFQETQGQLGSALQRLLVVVERYPQLTATGAFRDLQAQLEGTENRIAVARNDYTRSVQDFNTNVRTFPRNLVAGMFGFEKLPQFSVPEEETAVPKVGF